MAIGTSMSGNNQLIECVVGDVYSIIDSKIQYIDYKTKELVNSLINNQITTSPTQNSNDTPVISLETKATLFSHLEKQSRQKNILIFVRSLLDKENAKIVLSLLSDNKIFDYSKKELEMFLSTKNDL